MAFGVIHSELFNKAKIKEDYIASDVKDSITDAIISQAKNERKLEAYWEGVASFY